MNDAFFSLADLSYSQRQDILHDAIQSYDPSCYVREIFDGNLIYTCYGKWDEENEKIVGGGNYRIGWKIKKDYSVQLGEPQKVQEVKTYAPVKMASFSVSFGDVVETDDDYIYRDGKIFETGEWPDKQFTLSDLEADAAIAKFLPCDANLEHKPNSTLGDVIQADGLFGKLVKVWRVGKEIFGRIQIPKFIDKRLSVRSVSCEWDRDTKSLVGIAFTTLPRIKDAAVYSEAPPPTSLKETRMTWFEKVKALFAEKGIALEDEPTPILDPSGVLSKVETPAPVDFTQTAEYQALNAELIRLRAEAEARDAESKAKADADKAAFHAANEAVITKLMAEFRILPAQKETMLAARALNPALFDTVTAPNLPKHPAIACVPGSEANTVDAAVVYHDSKGDIDKAEALSRNLKALKASGDYAL